MDGLKEIERKKQIEKKLMPHAHYVDLCCGQRWFWNLAMFLRSERFSVLQGHGLKFRAIGMLLPARLILSVVIVRLCF